MELVTVGTGTVAPSGSRTSACHWVARGNLKVLLDCGAGALHRLAQFGLPWHEITHVVLSHFHPDHWGELPMLVYALKHTTVPARQDPFVILGPPGVVRLLKKLAEAPEVAGDLEWLRQENERLREAIDAVGPVNALAVDEHAEETKRLEFLMTQRDDLVAARHSLQQAAREIDQTAKAMFLESFGKVRDNFRTVFQTLFGGGECDVRLANEAEPLESEIEIHAAPRGKRTQRIHLLSSGERTLVAVSLLFAIFLTKPSPFCLLDEVDAPLDDANVGRYVRLLAEFKDQTQFIVITHNPRTMQAADAVYGVTMQEPGVSTIVGVRLGQMEPA